MTQKRNVYVPSAMSNTHLKMYGKGTEVYDLGRAPPFMHYQIYHDLL